MNVLICRLTIKVYAHISCNSSINPCDITFFTLYVVDNRIFIGIIIRPLSESLLLLKFFSLLENLRTYFLIFHLCEFKCIHIGSSPSFPVCRSRLLRER